MSRQKDHAAGIIGFGGLALALAGCGWLATSEPGQEAFWLPMQLTKLDPVAEAQVTPAQAQTGGEARFIVKVNDAVVDALTRQFRRDPEAARAAYQKWSAGKDGLEGLRLENCSYSGELILVHNFAGDEVVTRPRLSQMLEKIRARDDVAYADPEYTAHPGLTKD